MISIHALREESDLSSNNNTLMILYFNPRSPWGERQSPNNITTVLSFISIHALREESDCIFYHTQDDWLHFNPRSPWGERQCKTILPSITATFQSTLSVRRATQECRQLILNDYISIHALREESDLYCQKRCKHLSEFQSTLSVRRATRLYYFSKIFVFLISIHALREESDVKLVKILYQLMLFQSTLSVRRATSLSVVSMKKLRISIHALREESDSVWQRYINDISISIHALREESDARGGLDVCRPTVISIHALREESDRMNLPTNF